MGGGGGGGGGLQKIIPCVMDFAPNSPYVLYQTGHLRSRLFVVSLSPSKVDVRNGMISSFLPRSQPGGDITFGFKAQSSPACIQLYFFKNTNKCFDSCYSIIYIHCSVYLLASFKQKNTRLTTIVSSLNSGIVLPRWGKNENILLPLWIQAFIFIVQPLRPLKD